MKTIFKQGDYEILADTMEGTWKIKTSEGQSKEINFLGSHLIDVPKTYLPAFKKAGKNPKDYLVYNGQPVKKEAKQAILDAFDAYAKQLATNRNNENKRINEIFAGLDLLRAARESAEQYHEAFNRMMEDENNDGVNPPSIPKSDPDALAKQYPAAALYLKAEGYTHASNYMKSGAGRDALEVLNEKGLQGLEEASDILDNWLPVEDRR